MAFDIYGENLRSGHCEVHPWVHEEYPCSVCYSESDQKQKQSKSDSEQYQEYCEAHAREWAIALSENIDGAGI